MVILHWLVDGCCFLWSLFCGGYRHDHWTAQFGPNPPEGVRAYFQECLQKQNELHIRSLLLEESLGIGICVLNRAGGCTWANTKFVELVGGGVEGSQWLNAFDEGSRDEFFEQWSGFVGGGDLSVTASVTNLDSGGGVVCVLEGVSTAISQRSDWFLVVLREL